VLQATLATSTEKESANPGSPLTEGPRFLTVKEVAAMLRVCTATVYSMVERGDLEHVRVRNGIRIVVTRRDDTALDPATEAR
jgi:excisionase family DNA binding protein